MKPISETLWMLRVLSLGAGVQSTTVLLMSCKGILPKLNAVVFADTGWEPLAVYEHLERLIPYATEHRIPVHKRGKGTIRSDALQSQVRGHKADGTRWASMPFFTSATRKMRNGEWTTVEGRGMIKRQCTSEYKIEVIETFLKREILALPPRARLPKEPVIEQWKGISSDEASRMAPSREPWIQHEFPLCGWPTEMLPHTYTRTDCRLWLKENWPYPVPRSACIGCPFHSDAEWDRMKKEDPASFADAVDFDNRIRDCGGMRGKVYLHSSLIPLSEVKFSDDRQLHLFDNECAGVCGV